MLPAASERAVAVLDGAFRAPRLEQRAHVVGLDAGREAHQPGPQGRVHPRAVLEQQFNHVRTLGADGGLERASAPARRSGGMFGRTAPVSFGSSPELNQPHDLAVVAQRRGLRAASAAPPRHTGSTPNGRPRSIAAVATISNAPGRRERTRQQAADDRRAARRQRAASVVDVEDTFHPARLESRIDDARRDRLVTKLADQRLLIGIALPVAVTPPLPFEARPVVSLHERLRPQHVMHARCPDRPRRRSGEKQHAHRRRRQPRPAALRPPAKKMHRGAEHRQGIEGAGHAHDLVLRVHVGHRRRWQRVSARR